MPKKRGSSSTAKRSTAARKKAAARARNVPASERKAAQGTTAAAAPTPVSPFEAEVRADLRADPPNLPKHQPTSPPQGGRTPVLAASGDPKKPGPMELYVGFLRTGLSIEDAAYAAGVSPRTVFRALKKGRADYQADQEDTPECQFWLATEAAKRRALAVLHGRVYAAAADPTLWRAAAFLLERRHPKRYGAQLKLQGDEKAPMVFRMNLNPSGRGPRPTQPDAGDTAPAEE